MADNEKKTSIFAENIMVLSNPENFQKYILGTKSNGQPRAVYDILRECAGIGNKKKNKKKKGKKHSSIPDTQISLYMSSKKGKKKHKKKNKKHWHIDG